MTKQPDTDAIERDVQWLRELAILMPGGHRFTEAQHAARAGAIADTIADLRNKVAGLEAALLYCAETTTDKHTSRKAFEALSTTHSRDDA